MCSAYNQLGRWDEAIAAGKKALEIVPGDQLASNNLKISIEGKAKQEKNISDAEALAGALELSGFHEDAERLMDEFKYGPAFFAINEFHFEKYSYDKKK